MKPRFYEACLTFHDCGIRSEETHSMVRCWRHCPFRSGVLFTNLDRSTCGRTRRQPHWAIAIKSGKPCLRWRERLPWTTLREDANTMISTGVETVFSTTPTMISSTIRWIGQPVINVGVSLKLFGYNTVAHACPLQSLRWDRFTLLVVRQQFQIPARFVTPHTRSNVYW
jgi:hypothetical protein